MNMKRKIFIVSVCCLWIFQGIVQAQSMYGDAVAADVKMKYVYSLDEALHLAKKENKLIFCNCFEDWAIPCHGMNKKVFSNQEFARWMDGHFINFFIDLNTEEGEKFKSKYNIKFMAHYVVLDAEGNLVHRIVGGSELPEFQKQVACALSPSTSLAGMNKLYAGQLRDKEFLRKYAAVLKVANEEEKYKKVAGEYFSMLKPEEWSEAVNWPVFSDRLRRKDSVALEYLITHKADFVRTVGVEKVDNSIAAVYMMPLYYTAIGQDRLSEKEVADIRRTLGKAEVDEQHDIYALCDIAAMRLKGDILKMMDVVAMKVPRMDVRVARGIDMSLPQLVNTGKEARDKIVAYMNSRIAVLDKNMAVEYKSLMLEAGLEGGIVFEDLTLAEALDKAKAEDKYVFLDCYTSWCGPCKVMSKQVFVRKEVGDIFNGMCVNVKIDMEKGEGPEIAVKYGIRAYPTLLVLYPDGRIKYRLQGGTELGRFVRIARYALDPEVSYTDMKQYGSLSACPLKKQADYIIILSEAGELNTFNTDVESYLREVKGKKELYPEVWKLSEHFADRVEHPVFRFILDNWKDFVNIDTQGLENKTERLIFPLYIDYLAGRMQEKDFMKVCESVRNTGFRADYSLVYLDRLTTCYLDRNWKALMKCYTEEVVRLPDAKLRLNLDVLLRYFAVNAPDEVKKQMVTYVRQCVDTADDRAKNGYKNLLESINAWKG